MMCRWLAVAAFCLAIPVSAAAQDAQEATAEKVAARLAALEAEVTELRRLVATLTSGHSAEPVATAAVLEAPAPSASADGAVYGVGLDLYGLVNTNRPVGGVNLLRAYDVTSGAFSLGQASVVLERPVAVERGRRFGGRLDLQWGQATETLQGNPVNEPRPWVYRNVFQAYGTYVAPLGRGLIIDVGKWASALGVEGNYTKDQINYSRSLWFNLLPFYHMGARASYRASDAVTLNYWLTNGTQQTESFNGFSDHLVGVNLQPSPSLSWTAQYYYGREHPETLTPTTGTLATLPTQPGLSTVPIVNPDPGALHIFDTYATWQPTAALTLVAEGDYLLSRSRDGGDAWVFGGALYARRRLTGRTAVAARVEFMSDDEGLFAGAPQRLGESTLTWEARVAEGLLVRTEWRRDVASHALFLTRDAGVFSRVQDSATVGLVWWWGTKGAAW